MKYIKYIKYFEDVENIYTIKEILNKKPKVIVAKRFKVFYILNILEYKSKNRIMYELSYVSDPTIDYEKTIICKIDTIIEFFIATFDSIEDAKEYIDMQDDIKKYNL